MGSFLVVFGSSRRRFKNALLRFVIMVVFYSSFIFITYITGQMVSMPTENSSFFAIWAWYLLLFHGISDTISAHSLEDNEQWRRSLLTLYITLGCLWAVIFVSDLRIRVPYLAQACISSILKTMERIYALEKGSKSSVTKNSKLVADFMGSGQHELPAGSAHHNYVIRVTGRSRIDIASEKVITVGKVWNCQGQLLSATGDPGSKMKDLCLSFSMYNLLCCHFAGFVFPQAARDRQWEFVRDVLLGGDIGAGENYQRPFRLIEQELGFLYDHLYTKYAILFKKNRLVWKSFFFVYAAGISVLVQRLFLIPKEDPDDADVQTLIRVTRIIIGVFMCLEVLQILLFSASNWGKLLLLCKYVQKPFWRSNGLYKKFVLEVSSFPCFKPWGRKLGQYSFLKSFDRNPPWYNNNLSKLLWTSASKGHAGDTVTPLSPEVQRAVLGWIKQNGQRLTKGRASFIDNGVTNQELLSACEFEKTSQVIMVWHIATDLCRFQHRRTSDRFVVAVELSKYCAYLVAFAPRFLPDHHAHTDDLFDGAVTGAQELLEGCKSMEDKYNKIIKFPETAESLPENVTGAGGWVARLLIEEAGDDAERLWKILADFWTEMGVFVAPSDDPWPHAEHLAQGGEFVTHLLPLLFHAGVSKRDFIQDAAMV